MRAGAPTAPTTPAAAAAAVAALALALVAGPAAPAAAGPLRDAAAALEAGRLDEARAIYERVLPEAGTPAAVWLDLCLVHYASGEYGRAIEACYRALPASEERALSLLREIAIAMAAAGVAPGRVIVPEPTRVWFAPPLGDRLAGREPPPEAGVQRAREPERARLDHVLDPEVRARLRGAPPPLPYRIQSRADDYRRGADLEARTGLLYYAPDTTPVVAGLRGELRRRDWGAEAYPFVFGEYLHAVDGTGGIGSAGLGGRTGWLGASLGLAMPWGKSEERRDVLVPGYTLGLHGELRLLARHEVMLGRSRALSIEASIAGGLNLGKAAIRLADGFSDSCIKTDDDEDCGPETPDGNPRWPLTHLMLNVGIALGHRAGHAPYARSEVFAPVGGP